MKAKLVLQMECARRVSALKGHARVYCLTMQFVKTALNVRVDIAQFSTPLIRLVALPMVVADEGAGEVIQPMTLFLALSLVRVLLLECPVMDQTRAIVHLVSIMFVRSLGKTSVAAIYFASPLVCWSKLYVNQ